MDSIDEKTVALVPFGKYKGQPLELLLADKPYLDWLTAQPWFPQRYQNIHAVIINYTGKPVETPDHNRMQVKFLDREYQLKLALLLVGEQLFQCGQTHFDQFIGKFLEVAKEKLGFFSNGEFTDYRSRYLKRSLSELDGGKLLKIKSPIFEDRGTDVSYEVGYGYGGIFNVYGGPYELPDELAKQVWDNYIYLQLRIELKPTVGDDFPAVLRQMRRDNSTILVLHEYTATGASWNEFLHYFDSQGIRVVVESDIDRIELPTFDRTLRVNVKELGLPE